MDAVIVLDQDGRIVDWSQTAETIFLWTRHEAVGRLFASLLIPDRLRDAFSEVHRSGLTADAAHRRPAPNRMEMAAVRRDGQEFVMELAITRLNLSAGEFILIIARDLSSEREQEQNSSRQLMQSRLMQQAAALSAMGDSLNEALGKCITTLCSITNWPIGLAFVPDESGEWLNSTNIWHIADDERLEGLDPVKLEKRFRRGEGFPGQIWETMKPLWIRDIQDEGQLVRRELEQLGLQGAFGFPVAVDGELVAVLEFFTWEAIAPEPKLLVLMENLKDQLGRFIERRRWMEERAQLAAIVDSSYDAIIGKDLDGRIISWNSGAEQVYGYKAEEVLGKSSRLLLPAGIDQDEPAIRDVIRTGMRLEQFETERRCKDGKVIQVSLTASPIRDSRGRIVGSSTIERNISQRIKRERELRQAKREAERANRTKSEFLANISHELRTPMNAILGMLNLGLSEELSEVMRDYLTTARDSAQDLLYLLNDLLDFSRMEAGCFELEREPFDLRETLNAAIRSLALRASEKGLELACHISRDVPTHLLGDGLRLRQVIVNLVGNAIKFTDQGEVVVHVKSVSRQFNEVVLRFSVEDTGRGISVDHWEHIFAPFTQIDSSSTRTESGTGLGLAIVKELVGKMGGTVDLKSEVGRGSCFSFQAPFPVLNENPQKISEEKLENLPVLVVDDNRTNRVILEETLNSWSMRPTVVENGAEALEAIHEADEAGKPFPLMLVDALMPHVDGFMLLETLQKKRGESQMPIAVLMLSSADRQTFKNRCKNLSVAAYLEKPVSQSELFETIVKVLNRSPVVGESVRQLERGPSQLAILLAEDTPANQKVVRAILEKRGHRVSVANNGREAVERIKQQPYDVVLMDVQMPAMDGLQATQTIRQLPVDSQAEVPIIAMTAHARREDKQMCLAAGMDAYIPKPIDANKLIKLVESAKRRPAGHQSSDTWEGPPMSIAEDPPARLINLNSARARMDDNEDLVRDLAAFFLEDAPQLAREIEQAVAEEQSETVQRAAHSLKGLAANFDAEPLIMLAMSLENLGREGDFPSARNDLPELKRTVRQVCEEFEEYLDGNQRS